MTGVALVFLALLIPMVVVLVGNGWSLARRNHHVRALRTQERFAELRQKLWRLAAEDELSFDSHTFRRVYALQTYIMRRPDQYEVLSGLMFRALMDHDLADNEEPTWIVQERGTWTPAVQELIRETGAGVGALIEDYSVLRRTLAWVERRFGALSALATLLNRVVAALENKIAKDEPVSQFEAVKEALCAA